MKIVKHIFTLISLLIIGTFVSLIMFYQLKIDVAYFAWNYAVGAIFVLGGVIAIKKKINFNWVLLLCIDFVSIVGIQFLASKLT